MRKGWVAPQTEWGGHPRVKLGKVLRGARSTAAAAALLTRCVASRDNLGFIQASLAHCHAGTLHKCVHLLVLGGLELFHAHSFDMRHVMPSEKLNAAVQTCQDTAGTEISSRELGFPHARTRAESEGRSAAGALS